MEFLTYSDTTYVDGCNAAVGQLKNIGIEATIKVIDRAPFCEYMRKGEYSVGFRGDSERLDPDDAYYLWLHSGEVDKNNWSRYKNKELDDLLEKGRTNWKWEERMPYLPESGGNRERGRAHSVPREIHHSRGLPGLCERIRRGNGNLVRLPRGRVREDLV